VDERELTESREYSLHVLDLREPLEDIFRRLHRASIQRKIKRADREGLSYESGSSEVIVDEFYRLLVRTRKRQGLLPQPRAWFRNLVQYLGDKTQIRIARKDRIPVAALLFLRHRETVVYKYGCSDERVHHLGGMPFLLWRLIEESKASGAVQLDLGRSDSDHESLILFKDRFGATRKSLKYYRMPGPKDNVEGFKLVSSPSMKRLLPLFPDGIVAAAAGLTYRHFG